ncbi:MAG: hypothetical protein LBV33_02295, partial [Lachnospiraceae bacterium]|nr:hypothetical protein [Lachnospiraceae bacterium]
MKKNIVLYLMSLILILLPLGGCAAKESPAAGSLAGEEQTVTEPREAYLVEEIALPQEAFYGEKFYGDNLYYIGNPSPDSGETVSVYRVDLSDEPQEADEATGTPVTITAGQRINAIAVDRAEQVHVLVFEYEGTGMEERFVDAFWQTADGSAAVSETAGSVIAIGEHFKEDEFPYANGFEIDDEGKAYVAMGNKVYVFNDDGSLYFDADCGGYIFQMHKDVKTGTVYVQWRQDGIDQIAPVDSQNKAMGSSADLAEMDNATIVGLGIEADGGLRIITEKGVYSFEMEQRTLTTYFEWLDLDVVVDYYDKVALLTDERMVWIDRIG